MLSRAAAARVATLSRRGLALRPVDAEPGNGETTRLQPGSKDRGVLTPERRFRVWPEMSSGKPVSERDDPGGDCRRVLEAICSETSSLQAAAREDWIVEHVAACAECARRAQQHGDLWKLLGQHPLPVHPPAPDFTTRIVDSILGRRRQRRAVIARFTTLATAACLLVAISLGVFDRGDEPAGVPGGPGVPAIASEPENSLMDDAVLDEVLGNVPEEDREVIALLHLASDLPLLDQIDLAEISAIDVDLLPEDDLALEISAEFARLLEDE